MIALSNNEILSLTEPSDTCAITLKAFEEMFPFSFFEIPSKCFMISFIFTLLRSNLWHLESIVTGIFFTSVVAKINFKLGGGSSKVFNKPLKTIDDLRIVDDEEITLEMYIMQLLHLKDIKNPLIDNSLGTVTASNNLKKETVKEEKNYKENNSQKIKSQLKNTDQIKTSLNEQPKLKEKKFLKVKIK